MEQSALLTRRVRPPRLGVRPMVRASVKVLEADPDLGTSLDAAQWRLAANLAIAPLVHHPPGRWQFTPLPDSASLGTLVLEGLIVVRVEVLGRAHLELLGPGDIISPWAGMGADLAVPTAISSQVVSPLRLAFLDRGFALRTARWPEIHAAIVQRLIARSRRLSLQSAINGLTRIEERLDVTLWQLGYRFGRMTSDGIKLQLPLTHSQLAEIVAAQRPSVTMALTRLTSEGRVTRVGRGNWLLHPPEPAQLRPLARQTGLST